MTIRNANAIQAIATASATLDRIRNWSFAAPPMLHQAANTNNSCHANGLKYQVVPGGYEAKFQSNHRAATYRTAEPSNVRLGLRTMHQSISGAVSINAIYSGSTSRLTGL